MGVGPSKAAWVVHEYCMRLNLSKIATTPFEDLDCYRAQCFSIISNELAEIQQEMLKEARKKRGRR